MIQLPALIPPGGESALRQRTLGADRARMLRELLEALEALTPDEPGLLLLEDAQWADATWTSQGKQVVHGAREMPGPSPKSRPVCYGES
jgi:hypothetical protein